MGTPIYDSLKGAEKRAVLFWTAKNHETAFPVGYAYAPPGMRDPIQMEGTIGTLCEDTAKRFKEDKAFRDQVITADQENGRGLDAFPSPGGGMWG